MAAQQQQQQGQGQGQPGRIELSPEDAEAIGRLEALGFDRPTAAQVCVCVCVLGVLGVSVCLLRGNVHTNARVPPPSLLLCRRTLLVRRTRTLLPTGSLSTATSSNTPLPTAWFSCCCPLFSRWCLFLGLFFFIFSRASKH